MKSFDEWKKENGKDTPSQEVDDKPFGLDTIDDHETDDDDDFWGDDDDDDKDDNEIEEPINDSEDEECNEVTDPQKEGEFDFALWVEKTECFGQNDLNDIEYVYKKIREIFEYLFEEDFDAEFDVQEGEHGIVIINKAGEEGMEKLTDILRNLWEEEMNEEETNDVADITIDMTKM